MWFHQIFDSTHVRCYRTFVRLRVASLSPNAPDNLPNVRILEILYYILLSRKIAGQNV